jgi:hypothetical protein
MNNAIITLFRLLTGVLSIFLGLGIMAADNPIFGQVIGAVVFAHGSCGVQELVQEWKWTP